MRINLRVSFHIEQSFTLLDYFSVSCNQIQLYCLQRMASSGSWPQNCRFYPPSYPCPHHQPTPHPSFQCLTLKMSENEKYISKENKYWLWGVSKRGWPMMCTVLEYLLTEQWSCCYLYFAKVLLKTRCKLQLHLKVKSEYFCPNLIKKN